MNEYRVASIRLPRWYRGIQPNERGGARRYQQLAFDTETSCGYPYTLQISDGQGSTLWYLRPRQFLPQLIRLVRASAQSGRRSVVLGGFNLAYDLPAILYPHAKRFASSSFTIRCQKAAIDVFYGRIPFAKIRFGKKVVWVVDWFAFVWCSLAKAARMYALPVQKAPRPPGLGTRVLRGRRFERYALADAETTWHLGEKILDLHREFDVRLCVSIAQFAGRVFRHHFLHYPFPAPPAEVMRASLLSYHGGKNGYYLKGPVWVRDCREYDLRSAYPWAMAQMPSLSKGVWKHVDTVQPGAWGFYHIVGITQPDRYPILYDHTFLPIRSRMEGIWVTSYELNEALRWKEIQLDSCHGWIWHAISTDHPLKAFVTDFYQRKQEARTPQEREVFKLILNSLYGKFIQLNLQPDGTEKPGALFYPVLASWITGLVRARMHALEHKAQALHTATDAIHTTRAMPTGSNLGDLEEVQRGPALLIRNKVYFHFAEDGSNVKYATHGIHLSAERFWRALVKGQRRYTVTHLMRPREALRRGLRMLEPVVQSYQLDLGEVPMNEAPAVARSFFSRGHEAHSTHVQQR